LSFTIFFYHLLFNVKVIITKLSLGLQSLKEKKELNPIYEHLSPEEILAEQRRRKGAGRAQEGRR
jgi:hypothetical protein